MAKNTTTRWDALSMRDRASLIKLYSQAGVRKLDDMRAHYNKFDMGGGLAVPGKIASEVAKRQVRKLLYDNIKPFSYENAVERVTSAFAGINQNERTPSGDIYYDPNRDDIWAEYLGIPQSERHKIPGVSRVIDSNYSPSKGGAGKYKTIKGMMGPGYMDDVLIKEAENLSLKIGENRVTKALDPLFGNHTIGRGVDEKRGEYVSVYDKWDLTPFALKKDERGAYMHTGKDQSAGIGKPVEFYDRLYLDDYYSVDSRPKGPNEFYGGYIIPAVVTAPKAHGGSIHINPKNRGKFNALLKRTGKSASWFKEHGTPLQRKRATFALNARKWKHPDGGDINVLGNPNYNKAQEEYMYRYLKDSGMDDTHVAAIMGNIAVESLLNADQNQDRGPAWGLIQAEGNRQEAMRNYNDIPYLFGSKLSPEEQRQLDYIIEKGIKTYTPGEWGKDGFRGAREARRGFINETNLTKATDIFMRNYERPSKQHRSRRQNMSKYYYDKYKEPEYYLPLDFFNK